MKIGMFPNQVRTQRGFDSRKMNPVSQVKWNFSIFPCHLSRRMKGRNLSMCGMMLRMDCSILRR